MVCLIVLVAGCPGRAQTRAHAAAEVGVETPLAGSTEVPELPRYPGSDLISFESGSDPQRGFSRVYRATFTCGAPFEAVEGFYEKMILDGGWRLLSTSVYRRVADGARSSVQLTLSKGSSLAVVRIARESELIAFAIERKDR